MEKQVFHTATSKDIKEGKVTDVYFLRTLEILKAKKIDKYVKAEFIAKSLPDGWAWAVLSGIEEIRELCKGLRISVKAMNEGTFFRPYEPVMTVEGMYTQFVLFETALLGFICQSSGIATQAARFRKLAEGRTIISFGARRMHPALAPMIERSAYLGGCDGVAVVKSAELIGLEASGTMPHSLILVFGDTVKAVEAFHEVVDRKIKRVALVDTFADEKFETLRVAQALGKDLFAVRLDTPTSRRGDFAKILEEVRWELNLRGFEHVKLFVSGGINEENISRLNPFVDAYGIGTAISDAPVVDFSMDIIEIEGEPFCKRGKMGGEKQVLRCQKCFRDQTVSISKTPRHSKKQKNRCDCGGKLEALLRPLIREGEPVGPYPEPKIIRDHVLKQLKHFSL